MEVVVIDELLHLFERFFYVFITIYNYNLIPGFSLCWSNAVMFTAKHARTCRPIGSSGKFLEKEPDIHIFLRNTNDLIFFFDAIEQRKAWCSHFVKLQPVWEEHGGKDVDQKVGKFEQPKRQMLCLGSLGSLHVITQCPVFLYCLNDEVDDTNKFSNTTSRLFEYQILVSMFYYFFCNI